MTGWSHQDAADLSPRRGGAHVRGRPSSIGVAATSAAAKTSSDVAEELRARLEERVLLLVAPLRRTRPSCVATPWVTVGRPQPPCKPTYSLDAWKGVFSHGMTSMLAPAAVAPITATSSSWRSPAKASPSLGGRAVADQRFDLSLAEPQELPK